MTAAEFSVKSMTADRNESLRLVVVVKNHPRSKTV
jgi:hypothetical protein